MRVIKVIDVPRFEIIDATKAFSTPSAKLLMNGRLRVDEPGHAHIPTIEHIEHRVGQFRTLRALALVNLLIGLATATD
jgi:hypothetical protein